MTGDAAGAGPAGGAPGEEGRRWAGSAPAKVNLFLRILAREEGGHHQIETVFQQVELADGLEVEVRVGGEHEPGTLSLELAGVAPTALGEPEDNLAVRAARGFLEEMGASGGLPSVRIRLEKRIPHGAGLGGGSSDAAAVLRGLSILLPRAVPPDRVQAVAGALGADVPFFLADTPRALAWGRGDQILPLGALPPREVLLLVPPNGIATPWAYRVLAEHRSTVGAASPRARVLDPALLSTWEGMAELAENAFQPALHAHRPDLEVLRGALAAEGADPALLSGSGSALFGVFASPQAADRADGELARRFPEVSRIRTRTRGDEAR